MNQALVDLIKASETKLSPQEWTNFAMESYGIASMSNFVLLQYEYDAGDLFSYYILIFSVSLPGE